jgi:ribosomal protein L3
MIPITILKVLPQEVLRFKTQDKDGYDAVVI